ncbi:MAG: serine hydrolase [Blautia sp.]|uniref:D-alanyl-D-alanine carboxypeptidase family protein n=1 Tax=unclassified Blautia TaxID=2648079 RepID=UPI0025BC1C20|nr:serine hydrolase [Blautia sp.]MCI6302771.1 serine hydrolase [Blautia sp.]MCI7450641.1 serine hydrolase [Blautia sp.]MDD6414098.1 serine hydrolase [Blautia sp.]MDY4116177.1 serine hydrolase [Blautia sp.]
MRTGKESSGRSSGRKSATPYKSAVPYKNMEESRTALAKSARPVHTVKLPKSQMPSRQTEEHKALQRAKYQKKRQRLKRVFGTLVGLFVLLLVCGGAFYGWNVLRGNYFGVPEKAFDSSEVFTNSLASKENMRTQSFAQKLCVSSKGNVDRIKNAALEDGQKGLLFSLSNHKVLYANGIYDKVYPASITKIMTAMLALRSGKLDDVVTITQDNVTLEEGSQVCGFVAGDQVTLDQLLHCLLVYSGNDAASAIAEYVGGSTENFVQMMNSYAAQLGCTGTHFTNPHGLQDENHYTTPYDIYLMLNEAFTYPEFTEITEMPSYTVTYNGADGTEHSTTLTATDHYLTGEAAAPKDVTILGGKTGTTASAGNCLAILTQNAYGKPFVSIVMGASTKELLYEEMNSLLQNINS